MKRVMYIFLISILSYSLIYAQQISGPDSTSGQKQQKQVKQKPKQQKVYYGGTLGMSFGNYFRISVEPLVGYKINPKFSVGGKIRYEYIKDTRYSTTVTAHNYGGSLFTRYRVIPQIYFHAEPAYLSYQYNTEFGDTERNWVPFVFVGGGYSQMIGSNTWVNAEVLFDVLQDEKSPYKDWEPFYSIGVGVGF